MKKVIYIVFILFSVGIGEIYAQQTIADILQLVESNNTTLKVWREQANADKIANRTGINMANPEVEFGYLWGSPAEEGNRTDLNVTQSFDFPTAYRYKSQLATGKNVQVDLKYEDQRRVLLNEVRLLCTQLAYQQKVNEQLKERLGYAKELAEAYEKRFNQGDIDILERNKTRLDYLNIEKKYQVNEVEIFTLKKELERLNGGVLVPVSQLNYSDYMIPVNFNDWFERIKENNPSLLLAEQELAVSRKQEQLTKAMNLPKITAGYTSERISGTTLQGFTIGVSIPLWEGKNTVKHQKAQTVALQMQQTDVKLQFLNTVKGQYEKAAKLSVLLDEYQKTLEVTNNRELLKKALDKGQLSLINYLLELSVYYETVDNFLETERDYHLAIAELIQWEW